MLQVIHFAKIVFKIMSMVERSIIVQNGLQTKERGPHKEVIDFKVTHVLLINARWEITIKYLHSKTVCCC
jgi:hypothetical protein